VKGKGGVVAVKGPFLYTVLKVAYEAWGDSKEAMQRLATSARDILPVGKG